MANAINSNNEKPLPLYLKRKKIQQRKKDGTTTLLQFLLHKCGGNFYGISCDNSIVSTHVSRKSRRKECLGF